MLLHPFGHLWRSQMHDFSETSANSEEADARREKLLASSAIIFAFVTGFVAIGVAVLAIPTKESIFCQTGIQEWLPPWGACPPNASSPPQ